MVTKSSRVSRKKPTTVQANQANTSKAIDLSQIQIKKEGLYIPDGALSDFIQMQPANVFAHIKDAKNNRYIICNAHVLKFFDLKEGDDLIGRTIFDIDRLIMKDHWGNYADKASNMEQTAKNMRKVVIERNDMVVDASDKVYIMDTFKVPLIGRDNQVVALMTLNIDHTRGSDLFSLLNLYKSKFVNKAVGLKNFVKYLGISDLIYNDLTEKEIICLLHMRVSSSYKYIAEQLNISLKTVESHISHIISKTKSGRLAELKRRFRQRI